MRLSRSSNWLAKSSHTWLSAWVTLHVLLEGPETKGVREQAEPFRETWCKRDRPCASLSRSCPEIHCPGLLSFICRLHPRVGFKAAAPLVVGLRFFLSVWPNVMVQWLRPLLLSANRNLGRVFTLSAPFFSSENGHNNKVGRIGKCLEQCLAHSIM